MEKGQEIQWYAIQVRSRYELSVAKGLIGKGFDPFVPQHKGRRIWSDRKVDVYLPIFPGYIFCQFDAKVRLPILTTPGVVRIVGTSKTPSPIEASEIEAVQRIVQYGCKTEPHPFMVVGTRVRVQNGPLAGVEGIIQGYKNRQLILSIGLIQRSVCIDLDGDPARFIQPLAVSQPEVVCVPAPAVAMSFQ
jgi:transcriptional antiterminator NusG